MITASSRPVERGAPRVISTGPVAWGRKNLFNSWFNSILTVVLLLILGSVAYSFTTWAFTQADWSVIVANFGNFMTGLYPPDSYWRVWSVLGMVMALAGLTWGALARNQKSLFGRNLLIGLGGVALFFVLLPMTRPYMPHILGALLLLVGGAALGQALGRKFTGAIKWISAGWFVSYFIALYLLGGGPFFGRGTMSPSLFYSIIVMLGGSLVAGWQLASRISIPVIPAWI